MVDMVEIRIVLSRTMRDLRHLAPPIGGLEGISATLLLIGSEILGGEKHLETSRAGVNSGRKTG